LPYLLVGVEQNVRVTRVELAIVLLLIIACNILALHHTIHKGIHAND